MDALTIRKLSLADQLNTALREIVEENGFAVVEQDTDDPDHAEICVEPPPGEERMAEFAQMAVDRCGLTLKPESRRPARNSRKHQALNSARTECHSYKVVDAGSNPAGPTTEVNRIG